MAMLPGWPLLPGVSGILQLQIELPGSSTLANTLQRTVVSKIKQCPPLRWTLIVTWE